jgi:ribosome-associated heat shock protein Hsp15
VREGERISVRKAGLVFEVDVVALSDRRGGAPDAAKLYRETPESAAAREQEIARRRAAA